MMMACIEIIARVTKKVWLFILMIGYCLLQFSCSCPSPVEPEILKVNSYIEILSQNDTIFNEEWEVCRSLPGYASLIEKIENDSFLFHSPIFGKSSNEFEKQTGVFFTFQHFNRKNMGRVSFNEFLTFLEDENVVFNQEPHTKNLFIRLLFEEKMYSNYWGNISTSPLPPWPRDKSGLEFSNVSFSIPETDADCIYNQIETVRIKGDIEGPLITKA